MREHFQTELQHLRDNLDQLGRMAVQNVSDAAAALLEGDASKAQRALHAERRIDHAEVQIEEGCLKIIALHQPVADDLRFVIGVLKVDHELERVSDLAACIATRSSRIAREVLEPYQPALADIAQNAHAMINEGVQAFQARDAVAARSIWQQDEYVDSRCEQLSARLRADILDQKDQDESRFQLLATVADLERIGDHGTNISKIAIYQILGRVVRHRGREFRRRSSGDRTRVLFVCVQNSARSQMAAAWLNHLHGDRYQAESAGLSPGVLNPMVVEAMKEGGIDISQNTPRGISEIVESGATFDYVITVCDAVSAETCPPVAGIAEQIQWDFEDPAAFAGSADERLIKTRRLRDRIRASVDEWAQVSAV